MKRYLMIMLMLIGFGIFGSVNADAQILSYRTTSYAHANIYNGRYYWSDWEDSNMLVTINLNKEVITIYSPRTQIYRVFGTYNNGNWYNDGSGRTIKYYVYDQDGDRGEVRLRVENNGNSQIYVDFNNVAWCYNVRKI